MPKEMLTLYTKLFVDRGNGDENLIDLLSTPDLGIGDPEKVEVTNLQDGTRRYINGLKDVGDSLEFEFNYTTDGYEKLKEIEESKEIYIYKVVLPDELCFEFEAALSTKITGAAVGEQIKMTINLTPYSAIKVGQYGENGTSQVNEYSTFTFRGSESVTYNARNAEMLVMINNAPNSITELYVNDIPQQIPQISVEELLLGGGGDDAASLVSVLQVSEGDIIKVKGGFSLVGNSLFENIINISDIKLQSNLEDCSYMFMNCTSLIEAPIIPQTIKNCTAMFMGCANLTIIPQENIDLMNNPPEGLKYKQCYGMCPLVSESINVIWGGTVGNTYTTFTATESGTIYVQNGNFSLLDLGDFELVDIMLGTGVSEIYVNDIEQNLPSISINDVMYDDSDEGDAINYSSILQVNVGDTIKIKGQFGLYGTKVAINNVKLQNDLVDCNCMFADCTGLTEAPIIPPTVKNCSSMFYRTNIIEAPIIPPTVKHCAGMFNECENLTEAPVISEGVTNCYSMFANCTSLIEAPIIPSTVTDCRGMFTYCTSLVKTSVIPSSVTNCSYMFQGCESLKEAPIIPSTVTSCNCMFNGCENLTTLPSENIDLINNHSDELEHDRCYSGCGKINNPISYDEIPDDWK